MHTGIPRKIFRSSPSVFKPVLNQSSASPSRLLTTSKKKSAGASSRCQKENIAPASSEKQGSTSSGIRGVAADKEKANDTIDFSYYLNNYTPLHAGPASVAVRKADDTFDQRDMKRKAAAPKALEEKSADSVLKNRCVPEVECIVDIPLQRWEPTFSPQEYTAPPIVPPSLIVTSPSDGDLTSALRDARTVRFTEKTMASGLYKNFLLDASLHNWSMRFGMPNGKSKKRSRSSRRACRSSSGARSALTTHPGKVAVRI